MSWLVYIASAWLVLAAIIPPVLYIGYGFAMAAKRAHDAGLSPSHVYRIDAALAVPVVLLDGVCNLLILPVVCLDFRPSYAFRKVQFKGYEFWFFELVTERLSRYNEDASEWAYRRWVAKTIAPFLDAKDPKGWHIRKSHP
jgi:hypothetical protein